MADIDGDAGPNVLFDTPDNDTINGLDGDDTITVTEGLDSANGGNDFDTLVVSYGGATADISGGLNNFAYGDNSTQNVIFTAFERFVITTGSGDDDIGTAQFSGNDIVNLGAGNDRAETGVGDDEANGGAGNDNINVGTGNDTADGGADTDRISANLSAAVSSIVWILPSNFYSGPIGSFTNFEYFGTVSTGSGNDAIVTGSGNFNETVNLGDGNDTITVSMGNDSVNGEGGDDDNLIVDYGGSTAAVTSGLNSYGNGTDRNVSFAAFERFVITTGSGVDMISTASFSGNDVVNLGGGNDSAETGVGDDEANGGAGNDNIDVGTGNDTADGGADTDRISANLSAVVSSIVWILPSNFYSGPIGSFTNFEYFGIVSTGSGNDAIVTGSGNFNETVNLGDGNDTITVVEGQRQRQWRGRHRRQSDRGLWRVDQCGHQRVEQLRQRHRPQCRLCRVRAFRHHHRQWRRRDQHRQLQRQRFPHSRRRQRPGRDRRRRRQPGRRRRRRRARWRARRRPDDRRRRQ